MKINLIEDLSKYTTIPIKNIEKLVSLSTDCISHIIYSGSLTDIKTYELDIGIGNLVFDITSKEIKYAFIPSKELEISILDALDGKDKLVEKLEKTLAVKLLTAYKDI